MEDDFEISPANSLGLEERDWTSPDYCLESRNTSLPGLDLQSQVSMVSPSLLKSYHVSMLLSLADGFREEAIENADPNLANNLRNLRDMDIGVFSDVTEYVGRGTTFYVQRTLFPDSRDVVLKSKVFDYEGPNQSLTSKLEAILLELRVFTHPPLRHHPNLAQLIQVGWQGDSVDPSFKWPVLIVDYADQGTLVDFFKNNPDLGFETRKSLIRDVAGGLRALHKCKIAHGDLKLANVLVYSNETCGYAAKLSDFGGALLDTPETFQEPTGTPPWTAPEYGTPRPRDDLLLSDVYALGLLAWRIFLNGRDPFADRPVFDLPADQDAALSVISTMKMSAAFIDKVMESLGCYCTPAELREVGPFFFHTIQLVPSSRSLLKAMTLLEGTGEHTSVSAETEDSNGDSQLTVGLPCKQYYEFSS